MVNGPFAVINNADDFYGRIGVLGNLAIFAAQTDESKYAMVGYRLKKYGDGVRLRGARRVRDRRRMLTGDGWNEDFQKRRGRRIHRRWGAFSSLLAGDTIVSMNLWGFRARVLDELMGAMGAFLTEAMKTNPLKCEYLLLFVVNERLQTSPQACRCCRARETWYGVTYREDLASVKEAVAKMKAEGIYTEELWKWNENLFEVLRASGWTQSLFPVSRMAAGTSM